jgi:glycosidase
MIPHFTKNEWKIIQQQFFKLTTFTPYLAKKNMHFFLMAVIALFTFSNCKLMKKKEATKHVNNKSMQAPYKAVEWLPSTNIYEVNVRQYTAEGTFAAFAHHLPRLKELGVETLWFMPITPIAQKNKKGSLGSYYACSDYTSINPEFGNMDDFKNLVKDAHAQGFKVIIDWVANHTGWDHVWTKQHPEYYKKDSITGDFQIASGMDDIIELDFAKPAVRKAMIEAMQFWVTECNIDGFRADLAFWVELDFWKEARVALDAVKPLLWLGEYDELENPAYGKVFDASYSWSWMHKTKEFYEGKQRLDDLVGLLKKYDHLGDSTVRAWFTTNHDENSWNGTEFEKYGDMAKALAVFSATWNGVPLLYSGQEIGNRKRIKFFDKDIFESGADAASLTGFYRALLRLKRSHPALRAGDAAVQTFQLKTTAPQQIFAFVRKHNAKEVLVILNLSAQKNIHFDLVDTAVTGTYKNIFSDAANDFTNSKSFEMQPWEFLVYEK